MEIQNRQISWFVPRNIEQVAYVERGAILRNILHDIWASTIITSLRYSSGSNPGAQSCI